MKYPLAIFAPRIGAPSETFIQRHMQDLLPGGTVVVANKIYAQGMPQWNVNCPVLILDQLQSNELKHQVVRSTFRKFFPQLVGNNSRVKRFLRKYQVQVIMVQYLDKYLHWLPIAKELGIRFYGHAHGYDVSERLRDAKIRAEYLKYNDSDGVITMSQASRERLLALGLEHKKLHVVPYGVDVSLEPLIRTKQETIRCMAVGRMVAKKAPIITLDAFRRASEVCPNLELDYIGTGELLSAVQQFIHALGLSDKVTLHGSQPNEVVRKMMKKADIFLQHSMTDPETGDEEGLPVGILEAMASGLPIVSTRHAGIPEAVSEGLNGYLVDEGDSVEMAERIITLTHSYELRQRMGEASWCRAKEHFTWEKEKRELLTILGL